VFFAEAIELPLPVAVARRRLLALPDLARTLDEATMRAFRAGVEAFGLSWPVNGPAGQGASRPIGAFTLPPYQRGRTTVVPLRWSVVGGSPFDIPADFVVLDANIELDPVTDADSRLAAIGSYSLPADVGRPADVAVVQAAAQRMGRSLVDDLALAVAAAARLARLRPDS
jgi:hypothetical protein